MDDAHEAAATEGSGRPNVPWPKAIVFDLDGTLVDTVPDIAAAINAKLKQDDLEPFSLAEVASFIGHGIRRLVERAYAARGRPLAGAALDRKVAEFQAIYLDAIAERSRPYPGALEFVAVLRSQGIKTGICTNKAEPLTQALLAGLAMTALFDAVVGGQPAIVAKPAADMLLETLCRLHCSPRDALMIGDSHSDVACARAAGVAVIGVTFGYTDVPMRDLAPDVLIDRFADALAAIAGLRAAVR